MWEKYFKGVYAPDVLSSPMAKIPGFQGRRHGFSPLSGNWGPTYTVVQPNKKRYICPRVQEKNTKEGRAVCAPCPFLASQQGWMFFCVSSSFSHLLMVAPPSIISACKERTSRLSWSWLRPPNHLSAVLPTTDWKLPSWSLDSSSRERKGGRERIQLNQLNLSSHATLSIGHWKAYGSSAWTRYLYNHIPSKWCHKGGALELCPIKKRWWGFPWWFSG